MIRWLAFWFSIIALSSMATTKDVERIDARLKSLEGTTCIPMVVLTPTGQTTICAVHQ